MKAPIIGIDLGTTFSLVAVLRDGQPTILPNVLGERLTPSAVSVRPDGQILVGAAARSRAVTAPEATALAFKRDMGTGKTYRLGSQDFTPVQLSALVLKALKADAEAALGMAVEEAIVTVPAYFGDLQRQATKDAGSLAGLRVDRIINEPTAAALAYGLQNKDREQRVVVLDLGGGTFDVTVLEIIEGVIEVQASAGDARLGGEDFDDLLLSLLQKRLDARGTDLRDEVGALAVLREAAQHARHRLTATEQTRVVLPELTLRSGKKVSIDEGLTRAECEVAWGPLIDRIRLPIERAMLDASLAAAKVDEVVLVGGTTRMPSFQALAARLFGRMPLRTLPPDEAIAMGAAVQAGLKEGNASVEDVVATDVAPFSLGVATSMRIGRQDVSGMFTPIIERGTTVPASRVKRFTPATDGATHVNVEVFQGEHAECIRNQLLGEYLVKGLPPRPRQENQLDFRLTYDLNGILEVEIVRVGTGVKEAFVIEKRPGSLSPEAIEKAREEMKKWKVMPRDLLPNATALERAEAAHAELLGDARAELAHAIAVFKAVLDGQNPGEIAEVRKQLSGLTAALTQGRTVL